MRGNLTAVATPLDTRVPPVHRLARGRLPNHRINKPSNSKKPTSAKNTTNNALPKLPKGYAWTEEPEGPTEKRSAMFRKKASQEFLKIKERATTQRMYVLDRKVTGSRDNPEQTIQIAGSTGNVYTVKINRSPTCDCPHAAKQCKHIVYILAKTLKAPENLQYQHGLLTTELHEIFDNAPRMPSELTSTEDQNRKPVDPEDECPICCDAFGENIDDITYCSTSCGNNIHKKCFQEWAKSSVGGIKCPFCRSAWLDDQPDLERIASLPGKTTVERSAMGRDRTYRNLGRELNLTGPTDFSTYNLYRSWY